MAEFKKNSESVRGKSLSCCKMTADCVLLWSDQAVHPAEPEMLQPSLKRLTQTTVSPASPKSVYQKKVFFTLSYIQYVSFSFTDVCDTDISDQRNSSDEAHIMPGASVSCCAGRGSESDRAQEPLERCPGWFCHRRSHRCIPGEGRQR